ncbi:MAG: integration host factor subunit beta [Deltaproteobacteria bacterium]|nr:integration host factor subunit beta [Deltaproteobacteria bacterium]MBI2501306.1 integration host factor subunit beta [Deltaproteobacteria bacterium]MBI4196586.1 integration host factor subunit beta [Deltaproteobacteria bacterium]
MTKSDLVQCLTEKVPNISYKEMEKVVNEFFDLMTGALRKGNRVELRGFGTFEVRVRPPRLGRNPKLGTKVTLGERRVPFFKAGKELKEKVNHPAK